MTPVPLPQPDAGDAEVQALRERVRELESRLASQDEAALWESEERFRTLCATSFEGIVIHEQGRILDANETFAQILGYERDEVIGMTAWDFVAPADRELAKRMVMTDSSQSYEVDCIRKDGAAIVLGVRGKRMRYQGHQVRVAAIMDMTERYAAETARRESEERYRSVYDAAPLAFVCWNTDGKVTDWNQRAEQLFGWKREEVLGLPFMDFLVPSEDRDQVAQIVKALMEDRLPSRNVNKNLTRSGRVIICEWNNSVEHDANGRITGVVSLALDITAQRRAQEELARHRDQLEALVADRTRDLEEAQEEIIRAERLSALGRLTEVVAHELRHPWAIIRGSLYLVTEHLGHDAVGLKPTADRIERGIIRCDRIIDELLAFARTTQPDLRPTEVDRWIEVLLRDQPLPEGVELVTDMASGVRIDLDRDMIQRCVLNVFTNACQALCAAIEGQQDAVPGRITVATRVRGEELHIRIGDNGPGISPVDLERLFEPLFSTRAFGVGLGLPIVKQIIEMHGGRIAVESALDKGTDVTLVLPMG